jgi:hypothetical protein
MDMIALEPVRVGFEGLRGRSGPLTLGQLNILEWVSRPGDPIDGRVDWVLDPPADARVSDIVETFAVLLARHEGLRTSYSVTDPPVQRTAAEGALVIEAFAVAPDDPVSADRRSLTIELLHRLRAGSAKLSDPLPLQVALVRRGEEVLAAAALCSHLAVDFHGLGLIGAEFAELVRDPRARVVGPARYQPLERAQAEREPRTGRRLAAAIGYWERQLERMPKHNHVGPRRGAVGESAAVVITSPSAGQALDRIALRTKTSRSTVVFAVVCAALSQRTGHERWSAPLMSGNRFEPLLAEYVGTVAQSAVVDLDLTVSGFDELVGRVAGATITAYRYGLYDVYERRAAESRVGTSRGVDFCLEPLFNGVEGEPATWDAEPGESGEPSAGADPTRLDWKPMPPTSSLIRFDMRPAHRALELQCWTGDTTRTTRADMESLLLAVERILVAAAEQDLDLGQLRRAGGLEPMPRGEDWLLIDYCWIELSAVQRLLEDALPSVAPRIFRSVDGRALVAYVPAGPHAQTPEEAHARCMADLPGRPSAMTPRWYVICDDAPAEPADPQAWRSRAVLSQGPGRGLL